MGHKGRIIGAVSDIIGRFSDDASTLCDAFCGSATVACHLAEQFEKPILAGDLQSFATIRAGAVITRTQPIRDLAFIDRWFLRAQNLRDETTVKVRLPAAPSQNIHGDFCSARQSVLRARNYIKETLAPHLIRSNAKWPITLAYGGYYFSLQQALAIDSLRAVLPRPRSEKLVALSALIGAASKCSASPGHTAQPLGITNNSLPHLINAWQRSICDYVSREAREIAPRHAKVQGDISVGSWEHTFDRLRPRDVAFCDPPYSDVQYSRFYHVLETLTRGEYIEVSGTGRNPPFAERPASDFSRRSKAQIEADKLLRKAAERGIQLVITFPISRQSNGLRAHSFVQKAREYFPNVQTETVSSVFSSLGGSGTEGLRPARAARIENIICCYY